MSGLLAWVAGAAAIVPTASATAGGLASRPRHPAPLRGEPLGHSTGLRLVVADIPPFVLDVDTGRVTPVAGAPQLAVIVGVVGVGGRAAVVVVDPGERTRLYSVLGNPARASRLGIGMDVVPAADGRSVWIQSRVGRSRCALRRVALDGRVLRPARAFPCRTFSDPPAGALGLVVNRTRIVDPRTGRTALRTRQGIIAVAGETLVLAAPGNWFTLLNARTRAEKRLPWPSILWGLDAPAVDPRGRYVALAFADPAWKGGPEQALDVWLLDTKTGRLSQLPGMPAIIALKQTSMAWTDDGRLVLLAQTIAGRDLVAVWRPGQTRLAVATVRLPDRSDSGSDSFAPVR